MTSRSQILAPILALLLQLFTSNVAAQTASSGLHGQVTDPSGAVVPQAKISIKPSKGQTIDTTSNGVGSYAVNGLAPGRYTVSVKATGFSTYTNSNVEITVGQVQQLDVQLKIEVVEQKVDVGSDSPKVSLDPADNAGAIILTAAEIDALSDDPDEMRAELQALAGPAAGPSGGQFYVDGFTATHLPPKASIREIRINQNPFSAQYDKVGFGRIEIFTKPGSNTFHGQISFDNTSSTWNSRNPFATEKPSYQTELFTGNLGGPLSKKASYFLSVQAADIHDISVVNALNPDLSGQPLVAVVPNPKKTLLISPRIDYQAGANDTFTLRYEFAASNLKNNGIGSSALPSQGFDQSNTEQTLQLTHTRVLNAKAVNEIRFQWIDIRSRLTSQDFSPTIGVPGAFTTGGNSLGNVSVHTDAYELQDHASIVFPTHLIRFGGRLRVSRKINDANSAFNGGFSFSSFDAYRTTVVGLKDGFSPAVIRAAGGGASQFEITGGQPVIGGTWFDVGLYVEDGWRIRQNLHLAYGVRYETQSDIHERADFAPRLGISWGLGGGTGRPKTVLRAGFGLFYERLGQDQVLQAGRLDGVHEQLVIVNQPDFFPNVPTLSSLLSAQSSGTSLTVYQIDPKLHTPYIMQTAITAERQLGNKATATVTYLNSRGMHQLLLRNINAAEPGTYDPENPASGIRPLGTTNNIYQSESLGIFKQNQLITNINLRGGTKYSLLGYYVLNYARSDTSSVNSFPSNQYDILADYGRARYDIRHRTTLIGTIMLPHAIRFSPFLVASSGAPFNIVQGRDLLGSFIPSANQRPTFASSSTPPGNIVTTPWGTFDKAPNPLAPVPGETVIPVNLGTGPASYTFNLRVSKIFTLSKKADNHRAAGNTQGEGAAATGYTVTLGASARNLFNHVNPGAPISDIDSPRFGQFNQLGGGSGASTANRRIDLQMMFSF